MHNVNLEYIKLYVFTFQGKSVELFDRHKDVENFILYGESKMSIYDVEILDNNQVVTSHDDGTLRVWDSETGNRVNQKDMKIPQTRAVLFSFNLTALLEYQ